MLSTLVVLSPAAATESMCKKQLTAKCACTETPSAVAAVAIPSVAGYTDAKILGFFINSENVLALTTVPAESSYDSPVTYSTTDDIVSADDTVTAYATKATSLAAVPLGGLIAVYGVVKFASDASAGCISLLSPVMMPLGINCEIVVGSIAASSDPKHDVARIYYRKPSCDTSTAKRVHEFTIAGDSLPRNLLDVYDGSDISNKSYLAAFYDSKNQERHLMYQNVGSSGHICDVNLEDQTRLDLKEAKPGMDSAGLTAIYIPDNHKTYCYYVCQTSDMYTTDNNNQSQDQNEPPTYLLYKAKCDWNDEEKKWEWSAGRNVTPITVVHQNTQLSVTSMVEARENYIVFTDPTGVITCKHDSW